MFESSWRLSVALVLVTMGSNPTGDLSARSNEGRLRIVAHNLASDRGSVRIYVHERESFVTDNLKKLEEGSCLVQSVAGIRERRAVWTSEPMPYGDYAIIVHHDANGDGVINFGNVLPLEAVGYSNYDHAIASYPDFDKARVTLDAPELEVRVDAFMQGRLFRKYLRE